VNLVVRGGRAVLVVLTSVASMVVVPPVVAAAPQQLPVAGVTASGDDGNVPRNTLDGDLATRWSDEGDGV
jgi:hypothetical protein